MRHFTGWRFPTAQDKVELEQWLRHRAAYEAHSTEALFVDIYREGRISRHRWVCVVCRKANTRTLNSAAPEIVSLKRADHWGISHMSNALAQKRLGKLHVVFRALAHT